MIDKRAMFLLLLEEAQVVRVIVNCKASGVALPEDLLKDTHAILDFGLNLAKPIDDLVVDKQSISATLSFGGTWFKVVLPWSSVFVLRVRDEAEIWWAADAPTIDAAPSDPSSSKPRGGLRSV